MRKPACPCGSVESYALSTRTPSTFTVCNEPEDSFDTLEGTPVPMSDFMALTKLPIIIFYGDNIPAKPSDVPTQDAWRGRLEMARIWRDTVNKHGGQVTLVHLPEIGIRGNTHFPFSDLNNIEIADQVSKFLTEKKLD